MYYIIHVVSTSAQSHTRRNKLSLPEITASTDSQHLVGSGLFPALTAYVSYKKQNMSLFTFEKHAPCPHAPTISIPPHPSFRSHSLKINAHFVVGIYTNLHAAHGVGVRMRVDSYL